MKTKLFLSFLLNLIFAWSLYLMGWNHPDPYAFLLVIPLVLSVSLTLSAGHWAMWAQGSYSKNRIGLNIIFNLLFAWLCYYYGWYDLVTFPTFGNGLEMIFLLALGAVFIHWALVNLQIRQRDNLEKRKRDKLDTVLRDLSQEDVLQLRRRLLENDNALDNIFMSEDSETLRERG